MGGTVGDDLELAAQRADGVVGGIGADQRLELGARLGGVAHLDQPLGPLVLGIGFARDRRAAAVDVGRPRVLEPLHGLGAIVGIPSAPVVGVEVFEQRLVLGARDALIGRNQAVGQHRAHELGVLLRERGLVLVVGGVHDPIDLLDVHRAECVGDLVQQDQGELVLAPRLEQRELLILVDRGCRDHHAIVGIVDPAQDDVAAQGPRHAQIVNRRRRVGQGGHQTDDPIDVVARVELLELGEHRREVGAVAGGLPAFGLGDLEADAERGHQDLAGQIELRRELDLPVHVLRSVGVARVDADPRDLGLALVHGLHRERRRREVQRPARFHAGGLWTSAPRDDETGHGQQR